jgi:EAL domain-containing protein (putative c-di-GMP-specific phosphodiesterase class I)
VLNCACRQVAEWAKAGLPAVPVAVNVSAVQFRRQDLPDLVRRALTMSGLSAEMLSLEITETAIMSVRERAVAPLTELRRTGVGLALDDFGTGYSSLSYLKAFPISTVKIDRSFVAEMLHDRTAATITEAIVSMAHILGLRVLAEGVEEHAQLAKLEQLGCDAVQGFLFSPAVPPQAFARLLENQPCIEAVPPLAQSTRSAS